MKQIYCGIMAIFFLFCVSCAPKKEKVTGIGSQNVYRITLSDPFGRVSSEFWTAQKLTALGARKMPSSFFDRAMKYSGTQFEAVSLLRIISQFKLKNGEDAVLLNCFDDYQGFLPIPEILKYDLYLATRIELESGSDKPGWLNPLIILVPDGKSPPFGERFLTANIRELKFVRSSDYYGPIRQIANTSKDAERGFEVYKRNCLFCHSQQGRGGDKGTRLNNKYPLSSDAEKKKFLDDFKSFHGKDNADKQDVEQFVSDDELNSVMEFLLALKKGG